SRRASIAPRRNRRPARADRDSDRRRRAPPLETGSCTSDTAVQRARSYGLRESTIDRRLEIQGWRLDLELRGQSGRGDDGGAVARDRREVADNRDGGGIAARTDAEHANLAGVFTGEDGGVLRSGRAAQDRLA